jgi:sec-independent protein translocase protein TatB
VFGVNGWEIVLLALIAVFVLGPDRLPEYAAKLAHGIRKLRVMAEGAKDQLKDQLGPEYEDINWRQYDPRQYDPRRIVKEALLDPLDDAIAPVRSEIDSVRSAASRKGDVPGGAAGAVAAGAVAAGEVGAEAGAAGTSLGAPDAQFSFDPAAYPRDVRAYDPARPTPYDPDAT